MSDTGDDNEDYPMWMILLAILVIIVLVYAFVCAIRLSKMKYQKSGIVWICTVLGIFFWPLLFVPILVYHTNSM